jgi:predicted aldo/keto reductase-like oxidoreductase
MRLPLKEDDSTDEERATKQARYAIDHGVNYVDTAARDIDSCLKEVNAAPSSNKLIKVK